MCKISNNHNNIICQHRRQQRSHSTIPSSSGESQTASAADDTSTMMMAMTRRISSSIIEKKSWTNVADETDKRRKDHTCWRGRKCGITQKQSNDDDMGMGTGRSQNNTINNSSNSSIDSRKRWQQPSSSYILWNSFSRNRTSGITATTTSTLWSPFGMAIVFLLCCCCFFWPISAAIIFNSEEEPGIRCFCDKQTCGSGTLVCSGKYCLIGVRTDDNGRGRLDQHCVDEEILPAKTCAKDWKKWSEVCICEENLCNTFAFLRSQIDDNHQDEHGHRQHQPSSLFPNSQHDGMAQRGASGSYHHPMQQQHDGDDHIDGGADGHNWLGSSSRGNRDPRRDHSSRNDGNGGYQFQPSRGAAPLVLLLVVLPLVVGAFTVFLVFLNYHCKML